jgi:hypothetical protein
VEDLEIDNIGRQKICSLKKVGCDEQLKSLKREIRQAKESHERNYSTGKQLDYIKISNRSVGRCTKLVNNILKNKFFVNIIIIIR